MRRRLLVPILLAVLIMLGLCLGAGYWVWATFIGQPPGVGPKAEQGYRASAPIIEALDRYHAQAGLYPESLHLLIPAYLAEVPHETDAIEIVYRQTEGSYRLEFRYVGPGMNICAYTPEAGWDCEGYY